MTIELKIPKTGMGISEGMIKKWLKFEGDAVGKGEVLVEIETAKAIEEIESPVTGTLKKILLVEDQSADIGEVIAILDDQ